MCITGEAFPHKKSKKRGCAQKGKHIFIKCEDTITVKTRSEEPKIFKQPVDGSYLSGIVYHTGSLVLK